MSERISDELMRDVMADMEYAVAIAGMHNEKRAERISVNLDRLRLELQQLRSTSRDAERPDIGAILDRVATAYGYLWHVNTEPGTPRQYTPEAAAYEARKILRGMLTSDQRGKAINEARAAMSRDAGGEKA